MTRRKVVLLLFVVCLTVLALLFHRFLPREAIVAQEHRLRGAIEENPLAAWLIGLAIYTAASLIPGTGGKAIICGWLFGLWPAVLMVDVALTAAALLTFSVSRFVFRHTVESRFQHNIAHQPRSGTGGGVLPADAAPDPRSLHPRELCVRSHARGHQDLLVDHASGIAAGDLLAGPCRLPHSHVGGSARERAVEPAGSVAGRRPGAVRCLAACRPVQHSTVEAGSDRRSG